MIDYWEEVRKVGMVKKVRKVRKVGKVRKERTRNTEFRTQNGKRRERPFD